MKTALKIIGILTAIAVLLIIGGFFAPPCGVIDPSVLTACGILFAFAALWVGVVAMLRGSDVTITHGQTIVAIDNEKD